jgi:hypothetical protein
MFDVSASLLSFHSAQITLLPSFLDLVLLVRIRGSALVRSCCRFLNLGDLHTLVAKDFQPVLGPTLVRFRLFGIIVYWPADAPPGGGELR